MHSIRAIVAVVFVVACAPGGDVCVLDGEPLALDDAMREASGLASSRTHDDVLWTHNDSEGGAAIFAIDTDGALLGRASLIGAQNRDWEDMAVARCPSGGPDGDCVFIADIGDNRAAREGIGIWVAAEPEPRRNDEQSAVFFRVHYPDGPRDAEALAVLPDGRLLIVSKGREQPIGAYRSAPLEWPGHGTPIVDLELMARLSEEPVDLPAQVTGAALDRSGRMLALRSYASLQLYEVAEDSLRALLETPLALDSLAEPQGEGVAFGRRGRIYLSSEAGPQGIAPRLTRLRCRLP